LNPLGNLHHSRECLKLGGDRKFEGRGHFFAAAGRAMRQVLVKHARDRQRLKRGRGRLRLELLDQADSLAEDPDLVLSIDELLDRLQVEDASAAQLAQTHLFGGLTIEEAADALGVSRATGYRHWKYARAWLRAVLAR